MLATGLSDLTEAWNINTKNRQEHNQSVYDYDDFYSHHQNIFTISDCRLSGPDNRRPGWLTRELLRTWEWRQWVVECIIAAININESGPGRAI